MDMSCPKCGSHNTERIEDGYNCKDCGFSETPIGWKQGHRTTVYLLKTRR